MGVLSLLLQNKLPQTSWLSPGAGKLQPWAKPSPTAVLAHSVSWVHSHAWWLRLLSLYEGQVEQLGQKSYGPESPKYSLPGPLPKRFAGLWLKRAPPGFPGGAVVENLPANAGDAGSSPGLGRSHMPRSN